MVFDEAHEIRNRGTIRHKNALQVQASAYWALSATPIVCGAIVSSGLRRHLISNTVQINVMEDFGAILSVLKTAKPLHKVGHPACTTNSVVISWQPENWNTCIGTVKQEHSGAVNILRVIPEPSR